MTEYAGLTHTNRWAAVTRDAQNRLALKATNRKDRFMYQATLAVRVESASKVLDVPAEKILTILKDEGIEDNDAGLLILDSPTTTIDDLVGILATSGAKKLKLKAAASLLKGESLERPKQVEVVQPVANNFVEAMKAMRPIQQWNDRELLEKYNQDKDPEVEQELHKRSSGRNFVVLSSTSEQGKEVIDIENSLELLKQARKRVTPSFLPFGDQGVRPIYPILSLNIQDRMIELCPICGETLFSGYCQHCQANFAGIGDDERAYVKLIADSGNFEVKSHSDRKAVYASASKGLEDLKTTWPSIIQRFEELKATNSLPKLRVLSSRPTTVKDPFFVDGNRSFGSKVY